MDIAKLFSGSEVLTTIVGAALTFILGIVATFLTQLWLDGRQKLRITYSKKTEAPLTLAKDELKTKLKTFYAGKEVEKMYFFNLKIANTGRKIIQDQTFSCLFANGTKSIDPIFPRITTKPPVEVGPVRRERTPTDNDFRYTIEMLGVGQTVEIDFLTIDNASSDFEVVFRPNGDVKFVEGDVSGIPTLEMHLQKTVFGLLTFYVIVQIFTIIPLIGPAIGTILGLPFLLSTVRSLPPIIAAITKKLQGSLSGGYAANVSGTAQGMVVGEYNKVTISFQPDEDTDVIRSHNSSSEATG